MLKNILITSLLSLFAIAGAAHADQDENFQAPALCGMSFTAKGGGLQIVVGDFVLKGKGVIACRDALGNETKMPVNVQIGGKSPVALKVAMGWFQVAGVASGIGYARAPEDLLGRYLTVNADGAFVVGAGGDVSMHLKRNIDAATISVALQAEQGIGFNVGFNSLTITPAN